jgi:hypothetical protein
MEPTTNTTKVVPLPDPQLPPNLPIGTPPPLEKPRPNILFISLAILTLAILAATVFLISQRNSKEGGDVEVKSSTAAEEGKIIADFPRELIIMADAQIIESSKMSGVASGKDSELNTLTLTYRTEAKAIPLQGAYTELAREKDYKIVSSEVTPEGYRRLIFKRPTDLVAVEVRPTSETTSEVSIYVTLKP